jgi:hypothetical protein
VGVLEGLGDLVGDAERVIDGQAMGLLSRRKSSTDPPP